MRLEKRSYGRMILWTRESIRKGFLSLFGTALFPSLFTTWTIWQALSLSQRPVEFLTQNTYSLPQMAIPHKACSTLVQWVRADRDLLADLRPGTPFDARASFQAFGERQFGGRFAGVACCCELPGEEPPRWEAALEFRAQEGSRLTLKG